MCDGSADYGPVEWAVVTGRIAPSVLFVRLEASDEKAFTIIICAAVPSTGRIRASASGKVILGVSQVISGRRYDDGPPPWGIMGV